MATGAAIKQSVMPLNIKAGGAIAAKRFVTRTGTQAGANANTIGVAQLAAASGDTVLVDHLGMTTVEAGAVLNGSEPRLETDANGRAVAYSTGPVVAILPPGVTSTAANQEISVILLPN